MAAPYTGGCLCGQVRFEIAAEPIGARQCWCRDCQRIASGSPTVNVLFPVEGVRFGGDITTMQLTADSGNTVERGFCPKCGSQLYSKTLNAPTMPMRVRAGVLDDPELCPPTSVIWVSSAPSWAVIDKNQPRHTAGPDSPLVKD